MVRGVRAHMGLRGDCVLGLGCGKEPPGLAPPRWLIKGGISLIGYLGRVNGRGCGKPTQIPVRNANEHAE